MLLLQLLFNLWLFKDGINLIENEFENFIHKFDKKYRDNATEYELRKSIFQVSQIFSLNSCLIVFSPPEIEFTEADQLFEQFPDPQRFGTVRPDEIL